MANIVCECGHVNVIGTHLCAKCGRPLTEEGKKKKIVDMRYDGTAIRSKTHKKSFIDRVWNFFSSVKVGVSLIIITLITSAIGTFLPQVIYVSIPENMTEAEVYKEKYGLFGSLYYHLGFSNIYSSWWFQVIIGMLAVSIIIASFDRGIPLYKTLKNQRVRRHESFMKRQRIFGEQSMSTEESADAFDRAEEKMKALKYNVRREDGVLLAERGRFARWGPYINHVGLIIFIFGVMLRLMPGFYLDKSVWVREGETTAIPGIEGYYIHNNKFTLETYGDKDKQATEAVNVKAKNYQSDVTLYAETSKGGAIAGNTDNLKKVMDYSIQVNKPLKYDGFALYQMDFRQDELKKMYFHLINKKTEKSYGEVAIDLRDLKKEYKINRDTYVKLVGYYPDFKEFVNGEPQSISPIPNNPAFIFKMYTRDTPKGETSFVAIQQTLEPLGKNTTKMKFAAVDTINASNFTVRKDRTLWILMTGGIIFMIGVSISSYWSHRRLWLQYTKDGQMLLASHTNKNWFSMKKDLNQVVAYAHLPQYVDQLDDEKKKQQVEKESGENI